MADRQTNRTTDVQSSGSPSPGADTAASECRSGGMLGCGMGKKGLKGMLLMAACCGAPLLLIAALPFIGSALGAFGASALSTLAVLACPVGMALMMWMMMRAQRAEAPQKLQTPLTTASPVTSLTRSQEVALREDILEPIDTTVTPVSRAQADEVTSRQHGNGHQTQRPALVANGSPAAGPTAEHGHAQPEPAPPA